MTETIPTPAARSAVAAAARGEVQVDPYEKECGCRTHTGPHWLHMDAMDKWSAWRLLARGVSMGALLGYAQMERERLHTLSREMRTRGIDRLDEAERRRALDEAAPSSKDQVRRHYDRLIAAEERKARRLAREHDSTPERDKPSLVARINEAERILTRLRSTAEDAVARHQGPEEIRAALVKAGFRPSMDGSEAQEAKHE